MTTIKVGIGQRSIKLRNAIINLVELDSDLEVIVEAGNGADLLLQLETNRPEIILLDVRMPLLNGFEVTRIIRKKYPQLKIVVFTKFDLAGNVIEMSKMGIKSFMSENHIGDLAKILRIIHNGGMYYPDDVAEKIRIHLNNIPINPRKCPVDFPEVKLTLLQGICKGLSSTKLGDLINKSPPTVEKYRTALYQRLGVTKKEQLITMASGWNLFE